MSTVDDAPQRKMLATLKAQLALKGYGVHELADGQLLVVRWGLSRCCPDLRTLALFAEQVGAK